MARIAGRGPLERAGKELSVANGRILVVDDEPGLREFVGRGLQRAGYDVVEEGDSTKALQVFRETLPDLVVLDIAMPKVDGYEVCRRIRELSQTPIVMMSAMPDQRAKMKALHLGADGYLVKPFGIEELESSVGGLISDTSRVSEPSAAPAPTEDRVGAKEGVGPSIVAREDPGPSDHALGEAVDAGHFRESWDRLAGNVASVVVADEGTIQLALLGLITAGHVLIEDVPGVGKTLLAKSIADSIDSIFTRVQCTTDLLPSEITGASIFNPQEAHFDFLPGPIFTNVLLADELNRTSPRTQAALLEAMAERQVTVDGVTRPLPTPFMVIATQNTQESSGTFPLPDTELDRFIVRIGIGIPSPAQEMDILLRSRLATPQAKAVTSIGEVLAMQQYVREVSIADPVAEFLVGVVNAIREHPLVLGGVSPRGTVMLQTASQGWAAIQGRDFVTPDDVQSTAPHILAHRLLLDAPDRSLSEGIIGEALERVPVPL